MDTLYVVIPPDMNPVIEELKSRDWLLTNFPATKDELYNPAGYLLNVHVEKHNYVIVLDRNIFSYIIASTSKDATERGSMDELAKAAIGLVLFCQFCEIGIEPNLALYEFVNYNPQNIERALDELALFRSIDNSPPEELYRFFYNEIEKISIINKLQIDREKIAKDILEYKWLEEWRSLYLIILKIVDLSSKEKSSEQKLEELLIWMSKEYRFSHVAIVFSIYLFSSKRMSGMIKYKPNSTREKKYSQLSNMTWDLYFMNTFIRKWQSENKDTEYIFASTDKVIKEILNSSILIAKSEGFERFKKLLTKKEYDNVEQMYSFIKSNQERIYQSTEWTEEYREKLITQLESEILG
jgi:hypothetical protein